MKFQDLQRHLNKAGTLSLQPKPSSSTEVFLLSKKKEDLHHFLHPPTLSDQRLPGQETLYVQLVVTSPSENCSLMGLI